MSFYDSIAQLPPDPIFGLTAAYQRDQRHEKLTLVTGYFRDQDFKIPVLKAVSRVEEEIAAEKRSRPYLPIGGDLEFVQLIGKLVFGEKYDEETICGFQTVGGTGALCLCGKLISQFTQEVAISNHTWPNHWNIFRAAGVQTLSYPYYRSGELVFEKMVTELEGYPEMVAVLLHANGHNPTGFDLSQEQWQIIAEIVRRKRLFPILDMAYQGFSKEPDEDAFAPRLFYEKGIEFALTYTCAKNFSIYGERAGALFFVLNDAGLKANIESQVKVMVRALYSNPPVHAAQIVKRILKDTQLKELWLAELAEMRERMGQTRRDFVSLMSAKNPEGNWEALLTGTSLFCMLGLNESEIERLKMEKAIYATAEGRINLTGLNSANLERVTDAIVELKTI